ncbi:13536_t:CDS:2 [Acaulospora colombiana]|uniref:13536_t:CDS:1 n=1 Tax=Acaulospora colombiana TaxID=27376 RepID=A0ACA9M365_9GLOM|nr:13536_t:CDS:2 [Acaulospora colombiana]
MHAVGPITVLFLMLIVFLLPKEHVCSRTAEYAQPISNLWNALVEFGAYPRWRSNVTKVETNLPGHIPPDGFEWFREFSSHGNIKYRIVERWEGKLLKREIVREKGMYISGSWTIHLEQVSKDITRVTIIEHTSVHKTLAKITGLFTGFSKDIDTFLMDLGKKFGQVVSIKNGKIQKKEVINGLGGKRT